MSQEHNGSDRDSFDSDSPQVFFDLHWRDGQRHGTTTSGATTSGSAAHAMSQLAIDEDPNLPRAEPKLRQDVTAGDSSLECASRSCASSSLHEEMAPMPPDFESKLKLQRVVGKGTFGVVHQATILDTNEVVAVKRVLQDRRYKNRELGIMLKLSHPNIIKLKHYFYKTDQSEQTYLNIIMPYITCDLSKLVCYYTKNRLRVPLFYAKLYTYQLARAVMYLHGLDICHRDLKPQNVLVDLDTHSLVLCDFGSAKVLHDGDKNIAYISSRFYRAPELIFEATEYTTAIDIWSFACLLAEVLLGGPMFRGESNADQLLEIITLLGTPSKKDVVAMNPSHPDYKYRKVKPYPLHKAFGERANVDAVDLLSKLLLYSPNKRLKASEICGHGLFDELRLPGTSLPNGKPLPRLFDFSPEEMQYAGSQLRVLIPPHILNK